MVITVFGLGFVGLTTALGFAHTGFKVYGIDVDKERLATLQRGELPFVEPYMCDELKKHIGHNLIVTDDAETAVKDSDIIFYCVGTPYGANGAADLTYLFSAIDTTLDAAKDDKFRVLVTKSTIPPSTTAEKIVPYVRAHGGDEKHFGIANNPEFLREGHCWEDFMKADRIVIGCADDKSAQMMKEIYEPMNIPIFIVSYSTGEFIKYLSNTLLATMISYSNEMAHVADTLGDIDVAKAFRILHMDGRWGDCNMTTYVYPGCGYGGYCLPKDTNALYAQAREKGFAPPILGNVIKTNDDVPKYAAEKIKKALKGKKRLAVLGLSFKPNSDDVRDTPAAKILKSLAEMGDYEIYAYDPLAMDEFKRRYPDVKITTEATAEDAIQHGDAVAILTAWQEFKDADFMGKDVVDLRYMM